MEYLSKFLSLSKRTNPTVYLISFIEKVLYYQLEVLKTEKINQAQREIIENDIKTMQILLKENRYILDQIFQKCLKQKKQKLDYTLELIEKSLTLNDTEILAKLLEMFKYLLLKPVLTEEDLKEIAKLSIQKSLKCQNLLKQNVIKV